MDKYIIEGGFDFYEELYKSLDIEETNEKTEEDNNLCLITNQHLTDNFVQLNCGHKFNYGPLFLDLKNHKQKFNGMEGSSSKLATDEIRCPYCRTKQKGVLPYYEELGFPKINGVNDINLYSDGNGGSAVITIKTTSVTFANKAATFYGVDIATITVTQLLTTIGNTASSVLVAKAVDAVGATVRTADGVYVYSSDANVINTGTAPAGTSCGTYQSAYSGYLCAVTGSNNGTATLTVRNKSTSTLSTVASAATTVKVNTASAASFTMAFDKATYAPGEVAYIVIKPLDAAKGAIGGATFANLFATGGITSSVAFGNGSVSTDSLTAVSRTTAGQIASIDGYASSEAVTILKVYMPASGGAVKITAKGGTSLPSSGQVDVTATATVTDNASAALAAVTALATTVASLKTLITTLTNLVLKIQKKVKA